MKQIFILILFFFYLFVLGQAGNSKVGITGGLPKDVTFNNVTINGGLYYEPPHSKLAFSDSAVVIAAGTNVQITNAGDSLFRVFELTNGMIYLKGDTQQPPYNGGYNIGVDVNGYGKNGDNWKINVLIKNGGVEESTQILTFRTIGEFVEQSVGRAFVMYFDLHAGDKVWLAITRTDGSGDFTVTSGAFNIQEYYRKL